MFRVLRQPMLGTDGAAGSSTDTAAASQSGSAASGQAAASSSAQAGQPAAAAAAAGASTGQSSTGAAAATGGMDAADTAAAAAAAGKGTTADASAAAAASTAPVKFELTLPEGTLLDQADVAEITKLATENKWSPEAAQAALNASHTALTAQRTQYRAELSAHTEIGGDKLQQTQQDVTRALDRFLPGTSPEGQRLRAEFNKSGMGDYAPFVLLMARVGKAMAEDKGPNSGNGAAGATTRKSDADALFGS